MECDRIGQNGMRRGGMGCDEMRCDGTRQDGMGWDGMGEGKSVQRHLVLIVKRVSRDSDLSLVVLLRRWPLPCVLYSCANANVLTSALGQACGCLRVRVPLPLLCMAHTAVYITIKRHHQCSRWKHLKTYVLIASSIMLDTLYLSRGFVRKVTSP